MSFLFFIKPSTITVDCLTSNIMVYQMAKIEAAIKFIPKWWKELPSSVGDHPYIRTGTLKKCSGFLDLYKSGFVLPMWCDLAIDVGPIGSEAFRYQYSDFESKAACHSENQQGNFCKQKNYQHLKLASPWHIVSKKSINWIFMDVVWNSTDLAPYRVLTGVINFKIVNQPNINLIIPREAKAKQILISYKTPLVHLIPSTETKVKLKHHLVDEQTLIKKTTTKSLGIKFTNRVNAFKSELKCPVRHN